MEITHRYDRPVAYGTQSQYSHITCVKEHVTMTPWMEIGRGSLQVQPAHISRGQKCGAERRKLIGFPEMNTLTVVLFLLLMAIALLCMARVWMHQSLHKNDEKLNQIMTSLNRIQKAEEHQEAQRHQHSEEMVSMHFPWLRQNNTLRNYFVLGAGGSSSHYQLSAVVFLHQHRAAGSPVSQCLSGMSKTKNLAKAPPWNSDSRSMWDAKMADKFSFERERVKLHMGQYSFGMCNQYKQSPCSYFTLFRDPMERAISSYHYCNSTGRTLRDEMCLMLDASQVTLREWILHHGSLLFQQLLFTPQSCNSFPSTSQFSPDGSTSKFGDSSNWPCWFKHRHQLGQLTATQQSHVLDYILNNLENWFSVVGLVEDFDNSMQMFEHVYGLPFSECHSIRQFQLDSVNMRDNRSNRNKQRDGFYDDNDPDYLMYDYFVKRALEADYKIYNRAKQMFSLQKQVLLNRLS